MLQFRGRRSLDSSTGKGQYMNWKQKAYLPLVSAGLAIVNVLVYLANLLVGQKLFWEGALSLEGIAKGEYGRLLWAMFLHGGTSHLCNNMILLVFLGAMIEKEVGHIFFFFVYMVSGIGGNLVSLAWKWFAGTDSFSIGASGAIFGLDGVLLALVLFSGRRWESVSLTRVIFMIGYSLYAGFTTPSIDNGAHVGGLMMGFIWGTLWCRWKGSMGREEIEGYEY